jgi:uncharacterized protein
MKKIAPLLLFFSVHAALLAQSTIQNIPNQKLINGSYVSNPDNILRPETVAAIDTTLRSMENKSTVQVAVVAVQSIGDADVFDFAQQLFVTWGIGQKDNDNGLLILLVKGSHTIRFHTGDGIEGVLPDATCKRIQMEYMVPEFKKDDYDAGMLAGIQETARIVTNPDYAAELTATAPPEDPGSEWTSLLVLLSIFVLPVFLIVFIVKSVNKTFDAKNQSHTDYPEMRLSRLFWFTEFIIVPIMILALVGFTVEDNPVGLALVLLYLYFLGTLIHRLFRMRKVVNRFKQNSQYYEATEFLRKGQWYWFFIGLLFIPILPYFFYHLTRKSAYRNHSRNCKDCGGDMEKLAENKEDAYLSQNQQIEEAIKSIDYDVWQCTKCSATEMWNFPNRHSTYEECPACHTKAYHRTSTRTIKSATYSSSGKGEETFTCKACGKTKKKQFTISQLVASTSSSSSSSDSSWSSSSSSSGGSWGGGSSSGGGASSSW